MLSARGRSHQPADQRPASRATVARDHAEVDRRRQREESDAAAHSDAVVDRLLARRQALRVHAAARQRHRAVDRRFRHGTGQVGHDRAIECGAWARPANGSATAARCCASSSSPNRGAAPTIGVPTGPNIQEHRGGTAPVRTYQDLLASAHDEALFDYYAHQPARVRRRRQRSTHRRRHARGVRDGGAVARWSIHPRPPRAASVFVAGAVPEFSGEHRGVESPGRAGEDRSRSCRLPTTCRTAA